MSTFNFSEQFNSQTFLPKKDQENEQHAVMPPKDNDILLSVFRIGGLITNACFVGYLLFQLIIIRDTQLVLKQFKVISNYLYGVYILCAIIIAIKKISDPEIIGLPNQPKQKNIFIALPITIFNIVITVFAFALAKLLFEVLKKGGII